MPCSRSNVGSARMRGRSLNQKDVRERKQQGLCCQTADEKNTPNRAESLAEFLHPEKNTCTFVLVHKCHHLKLECEKTDILQTYFANKITALAFEQTPISACFVAVQSLLSLKTNKKWQLKIQLSLPEGQQFTCCNHSTTQ